MEILLQNLDFHHYVYQGAFNGRPGENIAHGSQFCRFNNAFLSYKSYKFEPFTKEFFEISQKNTFEKAHFSQEKEFINAF